MPGMWAVLSPCVMRTSLLSAEDESIRYRYYCLALAQLALRAPRHTCRGGKISQVHVSQDPDVELDYCMVSGKGGDRTGHHKDASGRRPDRAPHTAAAQQALHYYWGASLLCFCPVFNT